MAALGLTVLAAAPADAGRARHDKTYNRVDQMITQLLTARDDDDREDAAEVLGRIGASSRVLDALKYAGAHDEDRGVRKDARQAAERVRGRILANELTCETIERKVPVVRRPARTFVVPAPRVVVRPRRVVVVRRPPRYRPIHRFAPPRRLGPHGRVGYRLRQSCHGRWRHGGGLSIGFSLGF